MPAGTEPIVVDLAVREADEHPLQVQQEDERAEAACPWRTVTRDQHDDDRSGSPTPYCTTWTSVGVGVGSGSRRPNSNGGTARARLSVRRTPWPEHQHVERNEDVDQTRNAAMRARGTGVNHHARHRSAACDRSCAAAGAANSRLVMVLPMAFHRRDRLVNLACGYFVDDAVACGRCAVRPVGPRPDESVSAFGYCGQQPSVLLEPRQLALELCTFMPTDSARAHQRPVALGGTSLQRHDRHLASRLVARCVHPERAEREHVVATEERSDRQHPKTTTRRESGPASVRHTNLSVARILPARLPGLPAGVIARV